MEKNTEFQDKRVVCVGGGTGTYTVLLGLKRYTSNLVAIVPATDSGGSSGVLRDEFGILPPGDIRRCLLALSNSNTILRRLFEYRFEEGSLKGHSFGNLFLTALTRLTGGEDEAIKQAGKILHTKGKVLPVTLEDIQLCARLEDGTIIKGETNIDIRRVRPGLKVLDVFLDHDAQAFPEVLKQIKKADIVVIGPGDLYTSIIPNLLVKGVCKALQQSKAKKVYVCNLMTKHGETDGYVASDFISEIIDYLGFTPDIAILNKSEVPQKVLNRYLAEKAEPVKIDLEKCKGLGPKIIVEDVALSKTLHRHDPDKLAKVILNLN